MHIHFSIQISHILMNKINIWTTSIESSHGSGKNTIPVVQEVTLDVFSALFTHVNPNK
jgi:hypothetical protein